MTATKPAHNRRVATTRALARINSTTIIELLRDLGALSRQQIGAQSGLSSATVNRLTSTLLNEGIVAVAGQEPSSGGRPSILLRYVGGNRLVAAVQLHADHTAGVLVDLDGKIVFRRDFLVRETDAATASTKMIEPDQMAQLDRILDPLDFLVATTVGMDTPCVAIGVAVPGTVDPSGSSVSRIPEIGWDAVPLGRILRERFDLPVVIENDANALAYGEFQRGSGKGIPNLVALLVSRGLGAGIITNGELHRGASAKAGEVGYLLTDRSAFDHSYDEHGDLEDRIGPIALTRLAQARGIALPPRGYFTAEDIFSLAATGNDEAGKIAEEIADMVAMAIAALVIVLDPEIVVIGSSLGTAENVIPAIQKRLIGRIIDVPRIVPAAFREDAVLLGVAQLAAAAVQNFAYLPY